MNRKDRLKDIFEDTVAFYTKDPDLARNVIDTKAGTCLYEENDYPQIQRKADKSGQIAVTKAKTFEAAIALAKKHPGKRIAVLNFASATNPGGGVKKGSSAQEECLCRCSTLYPSLTQDWIWRRFYQKNREMRDNLHTDACIYTPQVTICKTDEQYPERLEKEDWVTVDVISCAAPNLRTKPSNSYNADSSRPVRISCYDLRKLHVSRAKHILHIAAANNVDILVLGAFGCGAFCNDPDTVAMAYEEILPGYRKYFDKVEFAIYCRDYETENYDAFKKHLDGSAR